MATNTAKGELLHLSVTAGLEGSRGVDAIISTIGFYYDLVGSTERFKFGFRREHLLGIFGRVHGGIDEFAGMIHPKIAKPVFLFCGGAFVGGDNAWAASFKLICRDSSARGEVRVTNAAHLCDRFLLFPNRQVVQTGLGQFVTAEVVEMVPVHIQCVIWSKLIWCRC